MDNRIKNTLTPYQAFKDVAEMRRHVEGHIRANQLNESELRVLRVLEFRSKAIPGASWIKVATICDVVDKSDATVRRALRQLTKLGIIEKCATIREKSGGSGANIYVIKTCDKANEQAQMTGRDSDETQCQTSDRVTSGGAKEDSGKDAQTIHSTRRTETDSSDTLDKSFTSGVIPTEFRDLVGRYYNDALRITHLYKRAIIATKKIGLLVVNDELAIEAFKQTVQAQKRRKIRGSFDGYFYGAYTNMLAVELRRQYAEEDGMYNDICL